MTKVYYIFLYSLEKKRTQRPSKVAPAINFLLLIQLASMNVFHSMSELEHTGFIKVYRYSEGFFNHHVLAFFEESILKEVRILSTITVQS